jgi:hypothetical protein
MRRLPVRAALTAVALALAVGGALPSPIGAAALVDDAARGPSLETVAHRVTWGNDAAGRAGATVGAEAILEHRAAVDALVAAAPPPVAAPATVASAAPAESGGPVGAVTPRPRYEGTNHMWFPALGYDRSVTAYACSSSAYPANVVYRWGCAGTNNLYLFGHAWGVMKPLHDAYVAGRLRVGMEVVYADGTGAIHTYRITAWRLVMPADSAWAIAAQTVPSMTLQTCVGANSEYRLIVRLVRAS